MQDSILMVMCLLTRDRAVDALCFPEASANPERLLAAEIHQHHTQPLGKSGTGAEYDGRLGAIAG
jgi:hypothetical protein